MPVQSSYIPVVLKSGSEELVRKDEFQFLMAAKKILFFRRSGGWAVLGRDRMRLRRVSYGGEERRHNAFMPLD